MQEVRPLSIRRTCVMAAMDRMKTTVTRSFAMMVRNDRDGCVVFLYATGKQPAYLSHLRRQQPATSWCFERERDGGSYEPAGRLAQDHPRATPAGRLAGSLGVSGKGSTITVCQTVLLGR